jgi:hypothetical protein
MQHAAVSSWWVFDNISLGLQGRGAVTVLPEALDGTQETVHAFGQRCG